MIIEIAFGLVLGVVLLIVLPLMLALLWAAFSFVLVSIVGGALAAFGSKKPREFILEKLVFYSLASASTGVFFTVATVIVWSLTDAALGTETLAGLWAANGPGLWLGILLYAFASGILIVRLMSHDADRKLAAEVPDDITVGNVNRMANTAKERRI